MNLLKKRIGSALVLVAGLLAGGVASATPITMNFDGLTPGTSVHKYYGGGCSQLLGFINTNCHGQDYGVVWKNAVIADSLTAPSPFGFVGFLLNDHATMNIAAGFAGGLSFSYYNISNLLFHGSVSVYSGLNGHGTLLSSGHLGSTLNWDSFDLAFAGVANSVVFHGSPKFLTGFDNITLGVSAPPPGPGPTPVPEPGALGVFGLGVLLMGLFAGMRRRYS